MSKNKKNKPDFIVRDEDVEQEKRLTKLESLIKFYLNQKVSNKRIHAILKYHYSDIYDSDEVDEYLNK